MSIGKSSIARAADAATTKPAAKKAEEVKEVKEEVKAPAEKKSAAKKPAAKKTTSASTTKKPAAKKPRPKPLRLWLSRNRLRLRPKRAMLALPTRNCPSGCCKKIARRNAGRFFCVYLFFLTASTTRTMAGEQTRSTANSTRKLTPTSTTTAK